MFAAHNDDASVRSAADIIGPALPAFVFGFFGKRFQVCGVVFS